MTPLMVEFEAPAAGVGIGGGEGDVCPEAHGAGECRGAPEREISARMMVLARVRGPPTARTPPPLMVSVPVPIAPSLPRPRVPAVSVVPAV